MSAHDEHGPRLEALFASADDLVPAFEASELASCDACRREVRETVAAMEALDGLGAFERAELERYRATAEPERPGAAEAALRAHVLGPDAQDARAIPAPVVWRRMGWVAAAAAVLALILYLPRDRQRERGDGVPMGDQLEVVAPVGRIEGERFGPFRWEGDVPPGSYVRIIVWGDVGDGRMEEVGRSQRLYDTNRWTPPAEDDLSWPDRIRWVLELHHDIDPAPSVSPPAEAERSSD